ncbi:C-type mannose receptor 2-like [Sphaeramia orbicularis]|uniref:C-type mannose receptor 2-like n=1 Tax=Sphaeramia orbicularis TaxID=375764 RepID=UPI00117F5AD6|nr:C-type mannose receptor 2-like [Sphaeramia orbicularis]
MLRLQKAVPFIGIVSLFLVVQPIPQQYHFINQSLTWSEAQSYCRLKYTDLATVRNMVDNKNLLVFLDGLDTQSWIGLRRKLWRNWKWSDGSGDLGFKNWEQGEPNNKGGHEYCVMISSSGQWNDDSCEALKDYICSECEFLALSNGDDGQETYVYYTTKRHYFASQADCRSRDGELASIKDGLDSSEITSVTKSWQSTAWIGLHKDQWEWSDGSTTSFRYWLSFPPASGGCVTVSMPNQGFWVSSDCNNKATFVCGGAQKVKKKVLRIQVDSGVDLTNLPVSGEILKQLETRLREQGVTDLSLYWRTDQHGCAFRRQEQEVKPAGKCTINDRIITFLNY